MGFQVTKDPFSWAATMHEREPHAAQHDGRNGARPPPSASHASRAAARAAAHGGKRRQSRAALARARRALSRALGRGAATPADEVHPHP